MGGSIEAFRVFYGRDAKDPSKPVQNAQEAYRNINESAASSSSPLAASIPAMPDIRPITPPIQADRTETHLEDGAQPNVGITGHILTGASALRNSISGSIPTSSAVADAEAGVPSLDTILPLSTTSATQSAREVAQNMERMQRNSNEQMIEKSAILSKLTARDSTSMTADIATAADVEAGTALVEIVPQKDTRKASTGSEVGA